MKKILTLFFLAIIALSLAFGLCSCGPGEQAVTKTVKFDVAGGIGSYPEQTVEVGQRVTKPADPTRDGYVFEGWYLGSKPWDFGTEVTRNMTLVAKWSCYNITYDLNGGINDEANPKTYTVYDEVRLVEAAKPGCVFLGWTYEGQQTPVLNVTIPQGSTGDRKYTANFEFVLEISLGTVTGIKSAYKNSIKTLIIPEEHEGTKITSIAKEAFRNCTSLKKLVISENLTEIGESAFFYCTSLKSVEIPAGVVSIDFGAFSNCTSLEKISISSGTTDIGVNAFSGCTSLLSISVDEANTAYKSIDGNLYSKDGKTLAQYAIGKAAASFTVPNHVTAIGNSAFFYCSNITSISFASGSEFKTIGADAFSGCKNLVSIGIPSTVDFIGAYAFAGCERLSGVELPTSIASIGDSAFLDCRAISGITLPSGLVSIGSYAFSGCTNITSISLPANVRSIGSGIFSNCTNLKSITVDDVNGYYTSIDGNVYTKDGKTLVQYAIGKTDSVFTVPASVNVIGSDAFEGCSTLVEVRFTEDSDVAHIGSGAFSGCTALSKIVIPDSVVEIGAYAFSDCSLLTVYCEAAEAKAGWDHRWNSSLRPVVWSYSEND